MGENWRYVVLGEFECRYGLAIGTIASEKMYCWLGEEAGLWWKVGELFLLLG